MAAKERLDKQVLPPRRRRYKRLALIYALASFFGAGLAISQTRPAPDQVAAEAYESSDCQACAPIVVHSTLLRSTFEAWTEEGLSASARFVPALEEGSLAGFKVYAVQPTSILASLGIRSGDTIRSIDGVGLTSVVQAAALYSEVTGPETETIQIGLVRQGCPLSIQVALL